MKTCLLLLLAFVAPLGLSAQEPAPHHEVESFLCSISDDVRLPMDPVVWNTALIMHQVSSPHAQVWLPHASWRAWVGDLDGDAILDGLPGLDALSLRPDSSHLPSAFRLAFSVSRSDYGLEDGSIYCLSPSGQGLELLFSEDDFLQQLSPTSGSFDVDALSWPTADLLYFSLRGNLKGTVIGNLDDGDVIRFDIQASRFEVVFTEEEIQQIVDAASHPYPGGSYGAIGDVISLDMKSDDEFYFSVQSPSSRDASIFSSKSAVIKEEGSWGFIGSTEVDALAVIPLSWGPAPLLSVGGATAKPGNTLSLRGRHLLPFAKVAGSVSFGLQAPVHPQTSFGMGGLCLNSDRSFLDRPLRLSAADAFGNASQTWLLPMELMSKLGAQLYFQILDCESLAWSSPVPLRIE